MRSLHCVVLVEKQSANNLTSAGFESVAFAIFKVCDTSISIPRSASFCHEATVSRDCLEHKLLANEWK